ncbi:MAG: nitrous oxide reductase family maturation protein NosD [Candidatus Hodarchaeota archaeon]
MTRKSILCIFSILLSTFLFIPFTLEGVSYNNQLVLELPAQYLEHVPIKINNNAEFTTYALVENWPGNGTLSSPYIISGYVISYYTTNLIYIQNCDVYFRVSNNTLNGIDGRYRGIELYNSSHGIIENNTIFNCHTGIQFWATSNSTIFNNLVARNDCSGIYLRDSGNISIINNDISSNNGYGIEIRDSRFCTLSYNTISYNDEHGILLDSSSENNNVLWNGFTENYLENHSQAYDDGQNNEFMYNYWSEWTYFDINADGIFDLSYPIEGSARNEDLYPLISQFFVIDRISNKVLTESTLFAGLMFIMIILSVLVLLVRKEKF